MIRAEQAAQLEIRAIHKKYRDHGWEKVLGCSGTLRAVGAGVAFLNQGNGVISKTTLSELREAVVLKNHTSHLTDLDFDPTRCEVLPGGLAIVCALFEMLGIEQMQISNLALREGVMYDLLGRLRNDDARQHTVQSLIDHWSVDIEHAVRVQKSALEFYDQVLESWFDNESDYRSLLSWAALLHEVGLSIAHAKYHEHGAYLLQYSDLAGFSRSEQSNLGALVRWHRRKFDVMAMQNGSFQLSNKHMYRLCILLRLAVLLHRPRTDRQEMIVDLSACRETIDLKFSRSWLETHPLTRADLKQERRYLALAGFKLKITLDSK